MEELPINQEKFIQHLMNLVEMERKAEINAMKAEIRRFSPEKRERIGRAVNNLDGKYLGKELGFNLIKYGRKKSFETEITTGDLVLLSKGDPLKSNLTATVAEKGSRFLVLALENIPKWALKNIRVDLYANDITFRRMLENLNKLNNSAAKAIKLLLESDILLKNNFKPFSFNLEDNKLDSSQKKAISQSLSMENFFLIHGPFGTGKTRTILELIKQEVKIGNKIIATAESNAAVDNILEGLNGSVRCVRLGHPQRVSKKNLEHSLAYKVENHSLQKKIISLKKDIGKMILERDRHHKPLPGFRRGLSDTQIMLNAVKRRGSRGVSPNVMISMAAWIENNQKIGQLNSKIQKIESHIIQDILKKSSVILCTNSSAALDYLKNIKFNLAVVDESSQATIPSVLIPLSKAKRFVLAGDHKQLPPTIIHPQAHDLKKTMFEELIKKYPSHSHMLNFQYRMNPKIMEFPNKEFYQGKIKASKKVEQISIDDLSLEIDSKQLLQLENPFKSILDLIFDSQKYLLFLDTSNMKESFESKLKGSNSIQNHLEAEIISKTANLLLKYGLDAENLGIISPYTDQVDLIKSLTKIEVSTVDGFQGREKDLIFISLVRSNASGKIGFLNDLRRLNVSLTRARRKLIIIGNSDTLKTHHTYYNLIKYTKEKKLLKKISDWTN
ncbi:IGHMBP2 family helicase [Methanobacterium alcaliphilum]|uniref:IGHMBP2 family helicase n=1 Tax=Methanobacterium alcaliphilum TaxID=392018 RepID=UPI00200A6CA2|nr:IGHMBP2 family helicase [Methanobacterium alcaliphilum]MCK9152432.1 IGHMBP2 family helicase [Methanobacterium alcaliphilum]